RRRSRRRSCAQCRRACCGRPATASGRAHAAAAALRRMRWRCATLCARRRAGDHLRRRTMRILLVALSLPLGGCSLTKAVWSGYGGDYETEDVVADHRIDVVGRDADQPGRIVMHAFQVDGKVAASLAQSCKGAPWIGLVPEAEADTADALLGDPEAFVVDAAAVVVDHRDAPRIGEQAPAVMSLTVHLAPDRIGAVVATAPAPTDPVTDRALVVALNECAE